MTHSNGGLQAELAAKEEEQKQIEPQKAAPIVKITLPDPWTTGDYHTYQTARNKYIAEAGANGWELFGKFFGSLALIRANVVRIEGLAELQELMETKAIDPHADLALIGNICRIAYALEAAINTPLSGWIVK